MRLRSRSVLGLPVLLVLLAGAGSPGTVLAQAAPAAGSPGAPIGVSALRSGTVVGLLGLPLGRLVKVEGLVRGAGPRPARADVDKLWLVVETLEGRTLGSPVVVELRAGQAERARLVAGQRLRLVGYETGAFRGIPPGLFQYVPAFAGVGYHFAHWFDVVKVD